MTVYPLAWVIGLIVTWKYDPPVWQFYFGMAMLGFSVNIRGNK